MALKDCTIVLHGTFDKSHNELIQIITSNGGDVKKSLSNKVTHFLCSSDTKSDKSAKSASELGIPIVQQKWLYDAIKKVNLQVKVK